MGRRRFRCLDCSADTGKSLEFYMLHDAIWLEANPKGRGMLCIPCIESRLGRALVAADFTNCFLNRSGGLNGQSDQLRARLAA